MQVVEVENLELGGLEVVKEFSIEVSSDEETTTSGSGEEKLMIDETTKCEETVGKASLSEHVEATPRKTPAKKTIAPKTKEKGFIFCYNTRSSYCVKSAFSNLSDLHCCSTVHFS